MKLHLPLPLRSALVAAVACLSAAATASEETVTVVDAPAGYRAVFNKDCIVTSYDSLMKPGSTGVKDSVTGYTEYITNGAIYGCFYQQVDRATHTHPSGGGHSTSYQNVVLIDEDGNGGNLTWNCSTAENPGVWIMAAPDSLGTATFTNYGDMVVAGSRQQWIKKQAAALSNGVVTDWTYTTCDFTDHALFSGVSQIGFNLRVTNTDSFTYKNAYTADAGAFVYGFKSLVFDNVKDITFSGNQAGYSGAIAYAGDNSWRNITDDSGFVVRNASGTVTFDNNSCSGNVSTGNGLFRNYLVRFSNVNEVVFSNNRCRLFSNYNYAIYTGFENCNRIVFSGNGVEGLNYIISSGTGDGILGTGSMRFDNCGDIVFSGNILGSCLFSSFPVFQNIDSLAFCGNTASGTLLTNRNDAITIGAVRDSFAIDDNVITGSNSNEAISAASVTVNGISATDASGKEIAKANSVSVSGNKVSGAVYDGFAYTFKASHFRKATFDDNSYTEGTNKSYSRSMFTNLTLTDVDDVSICGNAFNPCTSDISTLGTVTIKDFDSLKIQRNKETYAGNARAGLFNSLTLTGDAAKSTVVISENEWKAVRFGYSGNNVDATNLLSFSFCNNRAVAEGDADSFLSTDGNFQNIGSIYFDNNEINTTSGAVRGGLMNCYGSDRLTINDADTFSICNNKAYTGRTEGTIEGGVLYVIGNLTNVKNVTISGNIAGGIISESNPEGMADEVYGAVNYGSLNMTGCTSVTIQDNAAYGASIAYGGALGARYNSVIDGVGTLMISRNKAVASSAGEACGGAVYRAYGSGTDSWSVSSTLTMDSNVALGGSAYGGAVWMSQPLDILGSGDNASLIIRNNQAEALDADGEACGGAVRVKHYTEIRDFAQISITGNYAKASDISKAKGGAVYTTNAALTIENNDKVVIRGNYVTDGASYRLSGIESSSDVILNSGDGQSMEIYDGISTSGTLYFNKTAAHTGDILLSGKNTVADLKAVGSKATVAEIEASRTIYGNYIYLNAGTLQVKDGMKLHANSEFSQSGGKLQFENASLVAYNIGLTSVELTGNNQWTFYSSFASDELTFNISAQNKKTPVLTLACGSSGQGSVNGRSHEKFTIASDETLRSGTYRLISFDSSDIRWVNTSYIELDGLCKSTAIGEAGVTDVYFLTEGNITSLVFDYVNPCYLTWVSSSGTWSEGIGASVPNWHVNAAATNFYEGDHVTFNKAATVSIKGQVKPASIKVSNASGNVVLSAASGGGSIAGAAKLTKTGAGTLTIKNTNTFTGGTSISGGKVVLGADNALGSGSISISSGTLNLNGKLLSNNITASGSSVIQNGGSFRGNVTLNGTLNSGSWLSLYRDKTATLMSGYMYGKFTGVGKVVKSGSGTAVLKASNTYTGGTDIKAGTLKLGADKALGTGNVTMSGGTLDMNGKLLTNYISAKGSVKVLNGGNYGGNFVLDGTLADGSWLRVNSGKTATLKSGTVSGKFSGAGKVVKSSSGTVTFKGVNNCTGGTDITAGTLVLGTNNALGSGKVTMSGGTLNMNSKSLSNYITAKGSTNILNGGNYNGNYELSGNLGSNSWLRINSGKKATLRSGTMSGSLTGAGETIIAGKVNLNGGRIKTNKLTVNGSGRQLTANSSGLSMNKSASVITLASQGRLNSAGAITAKNIELSGSSVLNAKNSTARSIDLGGTLKATSSTVSLYGNLTAANVTLNNAVLTDEGSSTSAVKVTGTASVSNNAKFNIKGYLTGKNLTLSKGKLKQYGHNNGVSLSGTLSMNSGSSLTTSGTLSAGAMTLSGGTINMTSGSLKTITVSNTLTLNKAIDLNLGCSLTKGTSYKLITFKKTNLTKTSNLASLLGMSGSGATLTLGSNSITLKVTNTTAWNKYVAANKKLFSSSTTAMMPEVEEEEEILTTSVSETTEAVAAFDRSGADALVQSNWGMLNASRAFTDTIGNRASNRRALGEEQKSSVWMSAMGASSRLSSDGVAAGSDYNLFGAAFGMEQQLTEKSSLGLAIGNSRGKVSSFTSGRTKQDTLHTALYGQHLLQQSTSDALTLDWSAAYGRTESRWNGIEWDQRALQLDARATYAHQLNDKTTVSAFAGLQYYASDSATVAKGCESGSIQNLRGEIGVGIGHRATSKTSIYGELSFVGDMARNNPTATIGEYRVRGANPGRAGINLSAGVNHALNEKWSVNASYNMELMERANSHSANIGASYKF